MTDVTNLVIRRCSDLPAPKAVDWLIDGFLPRGMVTILVGEEGIGKSLFWMLAAAGITNGADAPGVPLNHHGKPATVLALSAENSWQYVDGPRAAVAGVNGDRLMQVGITDDEGAGLTAMDEDAAKWIAEHFTGDDTPALIVADPWVDLIPSGTKVSDPQGAREALKPWRMLAEKTGAAVLLVSHTNRQGSNNARDNYGLSSELRKAARHTLLAQTNDNGLLTIGVEKTNISPGKAPAHMFRIEGVYVEEIGDEAPLLVHAGIESRTAAEVLIDKNAQNEGPSGLMADILELMADMEFMADYPDGVTAAAIGKELGHDNNDVGSYLRRGVKAQTVTKVGRGKYLPALVA